MKEKKHIDELFQEQLQNYEAAPSPAVWDNIQAELKKEKEDRKVVPLWWKVGGVAAVITLLLTVGNMFLTTPDGTVNTQIVNEDTQTRSTEDQSSPNDSKKKGVEVVSSEENKELKQEKNSEDNTSNPSNASINELIVNPSNKKSEAVAVDSKNNSEEEKTSVDLIKKELPVVTQSAQKAVIASEANKNTEEQNGQRNPLIKKELPETIGVDSEKTDIAAQTAGSENKTQQQDAKTNELEGKPDPVSKELTEIDKSVEAVAAANETKEKTDLEEKGAETIDKGKSIFDAIEEDKKAAVAKVEEVNQKNWEVTPNVGPVFYNSLGEGSSIDPSFADNSQSGDVNFSYGVQVSYQINDRLSVRSGVSNVNLGYSTGGVELGNAPVSVALKSVDFNGSSTVLSPFDKGTLSNLPPPGSGDPLAFVTPKRTGGNAEVIQNLSYYEVPMELNYALVDKRFGVHMIGGFSTLFLGDNEISVQDGEFKEVLGEANNLNSVSFTTNVGLGFNYKISKRLKFNIEPMFKYQLNPYSDSSVDFKPYYVGVYSGLSFKF